MYTEGVCRVHIDKFGCGEGSGSMPIVKRRKKFYETETVNENADNGVGGNNGLHACTSNGSRFC